MADPVYLWPNPEETAPILTEEGAPFPDGGMSCPWTPDSEYYYNLTLQGVLLTREEPNGNSTDPIEGVLVEEVLTDSDDVRVIVADIGPTQEAVYVDGAFVAPYATDSTLDGDNYSVLRDGGWPSGSALSVAKRYTGQAVPPPVTSFWSTLYELDLRTLSSTVIGGGDGTVYTPTIDGHPWLVRAGAATQEIVNGSGLRLTSAGREFTASGYNGAAAKLLYASLPGYDAAKQTCVLVRLAGTASTNHGAGAMAWCGGGTTIDLGNNLAFTSIYGGTGQLQWVEQGLLKVVGFPASATLGSWVTGTILSPDTFSRQGLWGAWSGAFPVVESLFCAGSRVYASDRITTQRGAGAAVSATFPASATYDLTHIRVLQKAVP